MPNLAKSWEWSADGHQLTMHLVEGAKWSDGVPFTSEDVMFTWDDNIVDPNITPRGRHHGRHFRRRHDARGDRRLHDPLDLQAAVREAVPLPDGLRNFCPNPAHILKPQHPKYNAGATYETYKNFPPPDYMNYPVMGAWVVTGYRPDDIVILRRNPYYWKVDEAGNQLPYLDEVNYKLSTWADRDVQAVAGTGDFSNLEQPENFVESLKRAADARLARFASPSVRAPSATRSTRTFPANGWGEPDDRGQAVRELNRNLDFRTRGDRGDRPRRSLAMHWSRGRSRRPTPAVSLPRRRSTTRPRRSTSVRRRGGQGGACKAGLKDTDGNGFVNFPAGTMNGGNVEITHAGQRRLPDRQDHRRNYRGR